MACAVPGTNYFAPLLRELDTSPLASSAAPALATASGGTGGPVSSSAAAAAVDTASLNFTAFVPGASGVVDLSLAGTGLAQSSYAVGHAEATQLRAVLRTAHAYALSDGYHDRNAVLVAFQVSDAEGNTAVERSGLAVRLVLTNVAAGVSEETSSSCPSPDAASGLATCSCTVPAGWFSTVAEGSVSVRLEVSYTHDAGPLRLEQPAGSVVLHRAPAHSALDATGMTLALPASPRFVGDSFTARASASLVGVAYKLRSWYVAFHYDVALLRLESYQQDALWGDATVNTDETGVLKMLVLSPANSDADADSALLGGRDIPIATLTFVVQAAATGTHGATVSLSILSMTNFGTVSTASSTRTLNPDPTPNPDPDPNPYPKPSPSPNPRSPSLRIWMPSCWTGAMAATPRGSWRWRRRKRRACSPTSRMAPPGCRTPRRSPERR